MPPFRGQKSLEECIPPPPNRTFCPPGLSRHTHRVGEVERSEAQPTVSRHMRQDGGFHFASQNPTHPTKTTLRKQSLQVLWGNAFEGGDKLVRPGELFTG